jgi:ATP-dependent Clp protease ATP-binding subunit ClpB
MGDKHRTEVLETTKAEVMNMLKENMRPEFLNRIDDQIMFLPLDKIEIYKVLDLLLKGTQKMLAKQGLLLKMSEKAKGFLTNLGYDPQYGARPLKRVLQKEVINELSRQILIGSFSFGDTIYIDANNKGLLFSKDPFEPVQLKADEMLEDEN